MTGEPIKSVHLPQSTHRQLRILAAQRGTTLRQEVEAAVEDHLRRHTAAAGFAHRDASVEAAAKDHLRRRSTDASPAPAAPGSG